MCHPQAGGRLNLLSTVSHLEMYQILGSRIEPHVTATSIEIKATNSSHRIESQEHQQGTYSVYAHIHVYVHINIYVYLRFCHPVVGSRGLMMAASAETKHLR